MFVLEPLRLLVYRVLTENGKCIDSIIIHEQLFKLPRTEKNWHEQARTLKLLKSLGCRDRVGCGESQQNMCSRTDPFPP